MLGRLCVAAALLICATSVSAQQYKDVPRLGGPAAFHKPRLTNAASLKRMAESEANDIRTVLRDAGIPDVADPLIAAMSKGTSTVGRGNCSAIAPGDDIVECTEPSGSTYEWMAYRQLVKGKRQRVPQRIVMARYTGRGAFLAFLVRVTVGDKRYTFIVPKACSNISLVSVGADQAALDRAAREQAARDQAAREQAARDQAARDQAARDQAARDQAARDQAARDQAARDQAARDQAARDQAARDEAARNQSARNGNANGNGNGPGQNAPGGATTTPSSAAATAAPASSAAKTRYRPSPFFAEALLGGEHRNRPADLIENKPKAFTQGSGLVGFKVGAQKLFDSGWSAGGGVGYGVMFLFKHDTINQNPLFVDGDVNKYFANNVYVGGMFSMWDITRDNTWTPAAGARFGIPLGEHPKHAVYFVGEGRWFLDHRTHLDTHYLAWGGFQVHF